MNCPLPKTAQAVLRCMVWLFGDVTTIIVCPHTERKERVNLSLAKVYCIELQHRIPRMPCILRRRIVLTQSRAVSAVVAFPQQAIPISAGE